MGRKAQDAAAPARRELRTYSARFNGADGTVLAVGAIRLRDGARTEVVHSVREGKRWRHSRGATESHATLDAARARLDALASQAVRAGWKRREARGGFDRRPDVFDAAHLPAPGKARK